jgi:hypothetical protein
MQSISHFIVWTFTCRCMEAEMASDDEEAGVSTDQDDTAHRDQYNAAGA